MNMKGHILAALSEVFHQWETLLEKMGEEQATQPLEPWSWSTKDVLAHLWAWQQRSLARLEAGKQDRPPEYAPWPTDPDPDAEGITDQTNAWIYESNKDRSWTDMYQAWKNGFLRLLETGESLEERDLLDYSRYSWLNGYSLADTLLSTYDHHREHLDKLEAWLEDQADSSRKT